MYGKEDPWVRPIWALKIKLQLPEVPYYEISRAGHCPHDEVPEVDATLNMMHTFVFEILKILETGES
jgi:pimeloyl-ACP methyl ester carboxylesterase